MITISNTVQYTPASLPSCGSEPFTVTQTATFTWTTWCPGHISMQSGSISGTGTGACTGGMAGYCRTGSSNSVAPVFQGKADGTGPWTVYVSVTSVPTLNPGQGANSSTCGTAAITQGAPSNAPRPTCPCQNNDVIGSGPAPADCNPDSPIVIDTAGEGFHLTDPAPGVLFRARDRSAPIQMSWTDPAYQNAWLARPNAEGAITSLENLFGNFTPQPKSDHPNGYLALAYWAAQEGCGTLDHLDARNCVAVWNRLRLWTDANQDGIAQPQELHSLEALGVKRISLSYHQSRRVDEYGNEFRYAAPIEDEAGSKDNRCYDVFLRTQ